MNRVELRWANPEWWSLWFHNEHGPVLYFGFGRLDGRRFARRMWACYPGIRPPAREYLDPPPEVLDALAHAWHLGSVSSARTKLLAHMFRLYPEVREWTRLRS